MVDWVSIILFFVGLLMSIPVLIYLMKTNKSIIKQDITANQPLVENDYRKEFTDGYTIGVVKRIKQNKNGTKLIEFYPTDIEQGEHIKKPHLQAFVVKDEFCIPFPQGDLSDRRTRIKTVTRNPSMIPEQLKDTTEGKWATKEGQLGYLKSTFGSTIQAGDEAIQEILLDYARGEMTRANLQELKERVKIRQDIATPQDENKTN